MQLAVGIACLFHQRRVDLSYGTEQVSEQVVLSRNIFALQDTTGTPFKRIAYELL